MLTISDKLTCPLCGGRFQFHEAAVVAEALELAKTANRFGKLWPAVVAYAESFQTPGGRGLSLARLMAIVNELALMFTEQGFVYGRRQHRIDRDVLTAALKEVGQVGKSGFKNHNYLKVVAIDMQGKIDRQRGAAAEKKLREKEQQLMAGKKPDNQPTRPQGGRSQNNQPTGFNVTPPPQRKSNNVDQIGAIIDQLNFKPKKKDADDEDH